MQFFFMNVMRAALSLLVDSWLAWLALGAAFDLGEIPLAPPGYKSVVFFVAALRFALPTAGFVDLLFRQIDKKKDNAAE